MFGYLSVKPLDLKIYRNFLIAAGFYGIYYAVFQFLAVLWRRFLVQERIFSGYIGQISMWLIWEIPIWLFCLVSGYLLPYVIESERKYAWSLVLGGIFVLNSILFTSTYYAKGPNMFDLTTRFINIVSPMVLCALGTHLQQKSSKQKPDQGLSAGV